MARGLSRRRASGIVICKRCAFAGLALFDRDGMKTRVLLPKGYETLVEHMAIRGFWRRINMLGKRWHTYCDFCERTERREIFVLNGNRAICIRCVIDIYQQMKSAGSRDPGKNPGVTTLDYDKLSLMVKSEGEYYPLPIYDGYFERCSMTFSRKLFKRFRLKGIKLFERFHLILAHGPDGLRTRFIVYGSYLPPINSS